MPDQSAKPAIRLSGIHKDYRLYDSLSEQALDVLGFSWIRFWRRVRYKTFKALDGIDLEIGRGERVGIVGRNGAGKTTLLKLMTGNFAPTAGTIEVDGTVQALMQTGLGFHGEFTGMENIRSALVYSGLTDDALEEAVAGIVDFCELGDFIDQPVKTYSLGMRARLQFAAATAIKPDIVIIDEVLGAGDAYFSAKSSDRMTRLAETGCTLLIVSHSMQQVLQFCERAVWLERGRVVEDSEALPVVKAYERTTFEQQSKLRNATRSSATDAEVGRLDHSVSRWAQDGSSLQIERVRMLDHKGAERSYFKTGEPLTIEIEVKALVERVFPCRFLVLVFDAGGTRVTWHLSDTYDLALKSKCSGRANLQFDKILLNGGSYMVSTAIYERYDPIDKKKSRCYDLLSRSFEFHVENDFSGNPALIHHPARWQVADAMQVGGIDDGSLR